MRRRQAQALRFAEEERLLLEQAAASEAAARAIPNDERLPPGVCPKCRAHVGRALWDHVKSCSPAIDVVGPQQAPVAAELSAPQPEPMTVAAVVQSTATYSAIAAEVPMQATVDNVSAIAQPKRRGRPPKVRA